MRVLLTGAGGFIGSNVLDLLLEAGHEVDAVSRAPGPARNGVRWHECDLLHPDASRTLVRETEADHLVHLAWYAVPGRFWTAPENERWIDSTLRLLRAFGEAGGRRAVLAGTCAEYAWRGDVLDERTSPLVPETLYGACKHATHVAGGAVARQLGVSLAWARIFFLYGPGEDPDRLVSGVARGLLANQEVPLTEGRQRRDFMHVRDVAGAFVALLGCEVEGPVNVATGRAPQVREVATLVAEAVGAPELLRFGALPSREGEPELVCGDAGRLSGEVGFHPAIGLREGIEQTVDWWRARLGRGAEEEAARATEHRAQE